MHIKRKPVDLSRVRPDVLLLGARDAADRLGVPIDKLKRLLPAPDQWMMKASTRFAATLDAMTEPKRLPARPRTNARTEEGPRVEPRARSCRQDPRTP